MSHLPTVKVQPEKLLALLESPLMQAPPFNELASALQAACVLGTLVSQLFEHEEARNSIQETPKTPQDVAITALQLWKQGTWSKAQAMKVVHSALDEYREHIDVYSREVPAYRASLPPGIKQTDTQLIDQLFA